MSEQEPGVDPQASGQEPGGDGQEPKTFSEEYVKQLRAEAAKYRTELKSTKEQLGGFEDYDDLKAQATQWQELQEKQKTEVEKLTDQVANFQKKVTDLESARDKALKDAETSLIRSALTSAAGKAGYANPDDAYLMVDLAGLSVDDGEVKGVDDAIKAIGDRLPKAGRSAPSLDGGAGNATSGEKAPMFTADQLREQAVGMGVDPVMYAAQFGVKLES